MKDKDELRAEYIEQRTDEIAERIIAETFSDDEDTRNEAVFKYEFGWDGDTFAEALRYMLNGQEMAAHSLLLDAAREIARPFAERDADEPPDDEPTACQIAELMERRAA